MIDFTKIFQLKGLKPKNKGQTNFYECCDLTEKVFLIVHSLTATAHFYKQAYTTAVVLLPVYTTAAVQFMKNEDGSVIPPWDHKQVHVYSYISIQGPQYWWS